MGLWRDDENALLFRAIAGLGVFAVVVFAGSGIVLWKSLHPHAAHIEAGASLVAAEEKHEGGAKNEGGDATTAPSIGARAIPPEISHRQDGVPEPDNDLVEPEIRSGRGLASIIPQNDEPTAPYNPFITYIDILGSTSEQATQVGRLAVDISFEVDSYGAMKELQSREKEVKFVIGSLISELTYTQLRQDEGRVLLKKRIFKEVNYLLKKGKIRDVLYENFVMR